MQLSCEWRSRLRFRLKLWRAARMTRGRRFASHCAKPCRHRHSVNSRCARSRARSKPFSLRRLQKEIEQEGKVNTILLSAGKPGAAKVELTEKLLRDTFALEDLGIKVRALAGQHSLSLERETTLIDDSLEKIARRAATDAGLGSSSVFSYVVNTIRIGERETPYSIVTAVDQNYSEGLSPVGNEPEAP